MKGVEPGTKKEVHILTILMKMKPAMFVDNVKRLWNHP